MAVTLEELQIKFTAQMGGLNSQLNGVKAQINGIASSVKGTSTAFTGMARAAKLFISAFVIRGMVNTGKASIEMANDVVESEQLFSVSMKGMAGEARKWSEELNDSLGLNAYNLRRNVGTFNTMFMSMGLGTQAAYDMSTSLVQLAEDMASFYNVDPEEMFTKLRAGITGETEPLKRLGIMVDESTTKQYALSEGISKTGKELTQTEKLMARYAAIMAQTSNAQGDLARTIDSPVNQIRLLNNTLDQARVALGQAFQPVLAAVLPVLNAIASAALFAASAISAFINSLSRLSTVNIFASIAAGKSTKTQESLADSLEGTTKALKKGGGAAKQAAKDAKVGLKAFDEINKLAEETTKTGGGGGGGGLDETDVPDTDQANKYADALEAISRKIQQAAAAIREFWEGLKDSTLGNLIGSAWEVLKGIFDRIIKPIGEWAIKHPRIIGDMLGGIAVGLATFKIVTGLPTWLSNIKNALFGLGDVSIKYTGIAGFIQKIATAIRAHPSLAIAAAVAGGIAIIANTIKEHNETLKENALAERFGEISLSVRELEHIAGRVKTPFVNAMAKLKNEFAAIQSAAERIEQLAFDSSKILFGYSLEPNPLSPEQKTALSDAIQALIDAAIQGINAGKLVSLKAIDVMFGDGEEGSEVLSITAANWATLEAAAQELGDKINKMVADAMFDGDISPEEQVAVEREKNKLAKMAIDAMDIDSALSEVNMSNILINFTGKPTLTAQSVKDFADALNKELTTQIEGISATSDMKLAWDIALARKAGEIEGLSPAEIDAEVAQLVEIYNANKQAHILDAQLEMGEVQFQGVSTQITKAFSNELQASREATNALAHDWIAEAAQKMFGENWQTALATSSLETRDDIAREASSMMRKALAQIKIPEPGTVAAVKEMLEALKPIATQWQSMKSEMIARGEEIPSWLEEGLTQYEQLQALTSAGEQLDAAVVRGVVMGDVSNYIDAGATKTDSFASGILSKSDSVNSAAEKITNIAKTGFKDDSTGEAYGSGANMGQGYANGIDSKVAAVKAAARRLAKAATGTLRVTQMERSPSKITKESGIRFGEGYAIGITGSLGLAKAAAGNLANGAIGELTGALSGVSVGAPSLSGANINNSMTVADGGIAGAITSGIEQGVQRVMSALNINLNVDGERFGSAAIRTINDTQRAAGRLLLEM